jgi:peptidoglycan/xylan/chitin deacetylase (PgdA/CDA1 family)
MLRALSILGLVLAFAAPLAAQDRGRHAEARERWSKKSAAERTELEQRFEKLQKLDAGQRRQLDERMVRLRESKRRTRDRLPPEMRRQLDSLGDAKREEIVTELAQEDASQRGRDLLDRMPVEWREKLERAAPAERGRLLHDFKKQNRGPNMERALERIGEELALSEAEVRRLKSLPPEQREAEFLKLSRRMTERRVERRGLPEWISEAEWKAWRELSPREFQERVHARRREAGASGFPGRPAEGGDGRRPGGPGRERVAGQDGAERLQRLMRPDPQWRLDLKDLSPGERRAEVDRRVRERTLEFLEQNEGVVSPGELERLRGLTGRDLGDAVRKRMRERAAGGDRRPGGGKAPRGDGRPQGRPDGRPGGRQDGKSEGRPQGKPDGKPAGRPGGRAESRSDGRRRGGR